jgi:hypothetical protein
MIGGMGASPVSDCELISARAQRPRHEENN